MTSKNETAWSLLFQKYDILTKVNSKGHFVITSNQINEFRESRLMTKFDHKNNLPEIFVENDLSILPLTRGSYIIAKFQAYQKIEYSKKLKPIPVQKRDDLETLDYNNIYSESSALNCAFASGIIQDILGEDCYLTVNGRMSSKSFDFFIKEPTAEYGKRKIEVKNSQCEIDAGFESETKFALIEAKNTSCEDFLIRQLYYPYRLWKDKISKKVIPIFMTYSNDRFSFFIYEFDESNNYNSLKLVEQKDYIIAPEPITLDEIKNSLAKIKVITEPEVPFPQADNFNRIMDLFGLLVDIALSTEEITSNYDFDKRQTDYYFNAGRYLGILEKFKDDDNIIKIKLTDKGRKIMMLPHKEKNIEIVKKIIEHKPFKDALIKYFDKLEAPSREEIIEIMKKCSLYHVDSDSTYYRRSQTIIKWNEWILELVEQS